MVFIFAIMSSMKVRKKASGKFYNYNYFEKKCLNSNLENLYIETFRIAQRGEAVMSHHHNL